MSRKQSVILTPTERKMAVTSAKDAYRDASQTLAKLIDARKKLDNDIKNSDKLLIAARKAMSKAEQDLFATSVTPTKEEDHVEA